MFQAQLLALFEGRVQAQAQSLTDTPDHEVTHAYTGPALTVPTRPATVTDTASGTTVPTADGTTLHVHRRLTPGPHPAEALGHVTGAWQSPEGDRTRAVFATLVPRQGA